MRNMREFKDFVLLIANVPDHFAFCGLSERHMDYWDSLNQLSAPILESARLSGKYPPDVDAATELSAGFIRALHREFIEIQYQDI